MLYPSRSDILIALVVAAILVNASLTGLPEALGAHPWWAKQTGMVGALGGACLWLVLRRIGLAPAAQLIGAALIFLAGAAAAHFGKQAFVASFAENAFAGRLWYFGWFGVSGSAAVLLAMIITIALRR